MGREKKSGWNFSHEVCACVPWRAMIMLVRWYNCMWFQLHGLHINLFDFLTKIILSSVSQHWMVTHNRVVTFWIICFRYVTYVDNGWWMTTFPVHITNDERRTKLIIDWDFYCHLGYFVVWQMGPISLRSVHCCRDPVREKFELEPGSLWHC